MFHGKPTENTSVVVYHPKKGVTLGHVPITQFKEAKVFASKLDCI
jgi:hypothetical protein